MHRLFNAALPETMDPMKDTIFWNIRLPRALTAFLAGGTLSAAGAVMQAVLQNPLASSYTLGVSSGASLGAAIVIVYGSTIPTFLSLQNFMLPLFGFVFGLGTVLLVILISNAIDHGMRNVTVILTGMILSLFMNGVMTLLSSMHSEHAQQLWLWMTGSFSGRGWIHVAILLPVCIAGTFLLCLFSRELDILTFGEEQSMALGVDVSRVKIAMILISAFMTGVTVSFTGVIGFVDLAAPHAVRRIFGPSHRYVLPMSALAGGAFMAVCDLIARTAAAPREIAVGAVTALFGAPLFIAIFFRSRKAG